MTKKVAILQSNYIPWKGYFDIIASVDEFIIYDDVQFTKNDWRNRNRIITTQGIQWLTVPVGQCISRLIREVELPDIRWQKKHWKTLENNYRKSPFFDEVADVFQPLYLQHNYTYLSELNRVFIEAVCAYLCIDTKISNSWDYELSDGRNERLISLCEQSGATTYISGPSAKSYISPDMFSDVKIDLIWFDYSGYPEYPQRSGEFTHAVTILDLLFSCGKQAPHYMKYAGK